MEGKYLKEISSKLTVVIKLLISKDEAYKSGGVESLIKLMEGAGFSDQEMAEVSGKAVKTIRNTKSKMKRGGKSKKGKGNGK